MPDDDRLLSFAEQLGALHAAPDLPRLTTSFELVAERALESSLSVLGLVDGGGVYRAATGGAPRPPVEMMLREELRISRLAENPGIAALFNDVGGNGRARTMLFSQMALPRSLRLAGETCLIAPIAHEGEVLGMGLFAAPASALAERTAEILGRHTAVALLRIQAMDNARRLHSIDPRLWIPDEHYFLDHMTREVSRGRRYERPVGVALLRFAGETDARTRFGNFFTEHLLRRIGGQIINATRDTDIVAVYRGGFGVIHADTDHAGTEISAERLRRSLARMIELRFPEVQNTSMTCAIASYPSDGGTAEDVLACLDSHDAVVNRDLAAHLPAA